MDVKISKNKYDRVMSRVNNRSRSSLKSSSIVTRHDIPSSVRLGAKPSVSNVSSSVFSELPTVLTDYVPESSRDKVRRTFVVKPRKTLTSLDPALSPPRLVPNTQKLSEKPSNLRVGASAPSFFPYNSEKCSGSQLRECLSSRSPSRLKELKDEIREYHKTEKQLKLRSHIYKKCGIVLDDVGNVAADKAVQVEDVGAGAEDKAQTEIRLHNTLIHVDDDKPVKATGSEQAQLVNLHISQPVAETVLLPTARVLVTGANNKRFVVRALLDCGSQTSFCTTGLAKQLGLPLFDLQKNISILGDACTNLANKGINLCIESLANDFKLNITCSLINKITSKLPQRQIDLSGFIIPKHVVLADSEFYIPGHISLLLAADVFFRIILDGKIEGGPADPILLNTHLGYIISSSTCNSNVKSITMHTVTHPDLDHCISQFWEAEKVPDIYHESLPENEYSEKIFKDSISLQNNTLQVKYPLKVELQDIDPSNSYAIALQRLYNLEKRFLKDPGYYDLYRNFIQEYLDLGHAKIINTKTCDPIDQPLFFLPHHGVLRPERLTNKLRVVFDGSAKTKGGLSLNDLMCNGPVVQRSLFDILIQFRKYKYTLQCDVRHMYRMIFIHPEHLCLQNILWRENGVLNVLQLQTVTYGLTSSAYLATRCLIYLAKKYENQYPLASKAIINSSYIDDIQTGSDTFEEALQLRNEIISLMQLANFNLHKWVSNDSELLKDIPKDKLGFDCRDLDQDKSVLKVLGVSYHAQLDVFRLSGRVVTPTKIATKRNILSSISRLFDPMGFAGPVTMKAKLFLQELWQHDLDWDSPLPTELEVLWDNFYTSLVEMPELIIPRYIHTGGADEVELIGYCDASATGCGCCIYIKVKHGNECFVHLLCSKSRLNGINSKLTIPKLELNGSLLLANSLVMCRSF